MSAYIVKMIAKTFLGLFELSANKWIYEKYRMMRKERTIYVSRILPNIGAIL